MECKADAKESVGLGVEDLTRGAKELRHTGVPQVPRQSWEPMIFHNLWKQVELEPTQ